MADTPDTPQTATLGDLATKFASTRLIAALATPAVLSQFSALSDAKFIALAVCGTVTVVAYIVANTMRPSK